ncbi:MAG: hypothetical protein G3M78_13360 [Candidatus Nitrohelix vancouverensis]|uniref:L-2-amino-thiazoline-4-carboxylic acid hydrolase n=1 Tax=Candidatus Nitrohelix vancouverensis TaxID=2705534 RepID=A0A7T0C4D6_9BACT|nr:MAG: hypothetical protein G3M78_13360 [Candidatus Nitrohelix vancouverensis]
MTEENETTAEDYGLKIDPLLDLLDTDENPVDKGKIREAFVSLWEFEKASELEPTDQYLTTVALFIYTSHNILNDHNIRQDRARKYILEALRKWKSEEMEAGVAKEKATDNPFKAFVENNIEKIDEIYSWENFLLEHKKSDEKEWTYKMKKCWFAQFFIRFGRTDYIETACGFDQLPAQAREEYVDLKLNNNFMKLGAYCQFRYTPKKDS